MIRKADNNMLAQRPPMGWNSWNTFGADISEELIMETADAIVDRGLKDAGYEYVVIDDCWSLRERDKDGKLVADPAKFPHGMKYLSDYVHSKGLKFGMYSCAGTLTCAGYPSSFDHEFVDAQTFADWGVDYLKYDYCNKPMHFQADAPLLYRKMAIALRATGREILFSACNWGVEDVWSWARGAGAHIYRSTGDIYDNVDSMKNIALSQIDKLAMSGPGCYNDIDMLICGMYGKGNVSGGAGCTAGQYKIHFGLWCMMASPLMIGCDVRNCDEDTIKLLTNKDFIAINQDEDARPPYRVGLPGTDDVFMLFKHLANGRYAYIQANVTMQDRTNLIHLYDLGLPANTGYELHLTDVETGEVIKPNMDVLSIHCPANTCRVFYGDVVKIQK